MYFSGINNKGEKMKLTFFGSVLGYHQEALVCEFYNQIKEEMCISERN